MSAIDLLIEEKRLKIRLVTERKKRFLDLLLLGDEQENMINRYLENGDLWVLFDANKTIAIAVVTVEPGGFCELKNLAVKRTYQRLGIGSFLLQYLFNQYRKCCHTMYVGTGETPRTLNFYKKNGFIFSHKLKNFFLDNYDHPVVDEGLLLRDMVYLKRKLKTATSERK